MSLSSLQLDAFNAVAVAKSFSEAAKRLGLTQSALSQRVLNLEAELGSSLFIRGSQGLRITDLGQSLLRYCQSKAALEEEFLESIRNTSGSFSGQVHVAGFSTIMRSLVMPALAPLIKKHPHLQLAYYTRELRELPSMLESGEAGVILLNRALEKQGIENVLLGHEEYVLVEATTGEIRKDVYLDNDPEDNTTQEFFRSQGQSTKRLKRSYMDEIYSIIDGVISGAGRAVLPLHLAKEAKGIKIVKGHKPLRLPVYLCFYQQSYFTDLQKAVIAQLSDGMKKKLV